MYCSLGQRHGIYPAFFLIFIVRLLGLEEEVQGAALFNPDQSASAAGQGTAFSAQADDPSAIHYNPAGMTQLRGIQLQGGTNLQGGRISFENQAGASTAGDLGSSIAMPPPSHLYLTANLGGMGNTWLRDTVIGVGVNTPFGLKTRYPADTPFATATTFAALPLLDIKPTVSYKLNEQIAVGVGADIYTFASFIGTGQLVQRFTWPGGGGIPAGSPVEVNGSDTSAGFNVSLFYTPLRNVDGKARANIGVVYRSQATLHLNGRFLAGGVPVSDASTTLVIPPIYTAAVAIWPIRDRVHEWKLETDVNYTGWKSVRNLDVHLSNGLVLPSPQNWQSTYTVMVGTEYKWLQPDALPGWEIALRGGYLYAATPIPDRTFTPAIPDSNEHVLSIGMGFLCKEKASFFGMIPCTADRGAGWSRAVGLDVAYAAILFEPRTITGNLNPTVNGTYHIIEHSGTITLRLAF